MLKEFENNDEFNKNQKDIIQSSKIDKSEFDMSIYHKMFTIFFNSLEKDSEQYVVTPKDIAQMDIKSNLTETEVNKFYEFIQTIKNKFKSGEKNK